MIIIFQENLLTMDELEKIPDTDDDLVLISHESDVDSDHEC